MNDFEYEIMQMKRLARQAQYRKRGSKSKKCPMSTDRMTRRQWEKRCGEVVKYQLGIPIAWKEFKKLPIHIQKMYIEDMIQKYSVSATDLARVFDCTSATVLNFCKQDGIGIKFSRGKSMTHEQQANFERMLSGDATDSGECSNCEQDKLEENNEGEEDSGVSAHNMLMSGFSLQFVGAFNRDMIYNSLASIVPPGTNIQLDIRCSIL